jgi:CTP synthase
MAMTQYHVKELRSIGIQPDILICRSEHELPEEERAKIALFTNVASDSVLLLDSYIYPPWQYQQ